MSGTWQAAASPVRLTDAAPAAGAIHQVSGPKERRKSAAKHVIASEENHHPKGPDRTAPPAHSTTASHAAKRARRRACQVWTVCGAGACALSR